MSASISIASADMPTLSNRGPTNPSATRTSGTGCPRGSSRPAAPRRRLDRRRPRRSEWSPGDERLDHATCASSDADARADGSAPPRSQRSTRSTLWRRSQSRSTKSSRRPPRGRTPATNGTWSRLSARLLAGHRARSSRSQLALLAAQEADVPRANSRASRRLRDHHLRTRPGRVGPTQPGDHDAELEQQVLDVLRELVAVRGVGDLDRVARQRARRSRRP